jgi:transposase
MAQSRKGIARPTYTARQKAWAVAMVTSGSQTQKDVARQLGCCDREVRRWLRQADIESGRRRGVKLVERRELFQLRRTVRRQEQLIRLLEDSRDFFVTETR